MELGEYQARAALFARYPREKELEYLTLGLVGEAGEVANKVKKILRGDAVDENPDAAIAAELGDVLWYLSQLAAHFQIDLDLVAFNNLNKLRSRAQRDVLKGSGDNR